jgi:hypothetical protein
VYIFSVHQKRKIIIMNPNKIILQSVLVVTVVCSCVMTLFPAAAADTNTFVPSIIQEGFEKWATKDSGYAFDVWQKGGILEGDRKISALSNYFKRLERTTGEYKSYELIATKQISQHSETVYVAMNFEHSAIYARFLLYRNDKAWVVQNMDFNPRPEAIMPWLAFEGTNYSE